jgi:hypothetical protein
MKPWPKGLAVATTAMLVFLGAGETIQAKAPGPNGQIAFARVDHTLGGTVIYTANPDGSHQQQLYFGDISAFPNWSPDGSQVSIGTPCTDGTETIVDPDSGAFRQFKWPDPTLETDCGHWSADGRRLACVGFGVTDPSRNGIYTIRSSDGRGLTRITSNSGGDDEPGDYSPTGRAWSFSARTKAAPWPFRGQARRQRVAADHAAWLHPRKLVRRRAEPKLVAEREQDPVRKSHRSEPPSRDLGLSREYRIGATGSVGVFPALPNATFEVWG